MLMRASRGGFIVVLVGWLLVWVFCFGVQGEEEVGDGRDERPNVILFLVDDLGWQDLSVPLHREATEFNLRYRTPNVEQVAARGVRFTNAYASAPVCTTKRTSIMTGMSPGQ